MFGSSPNEVGFADLLHVRTTHITPLTGATHITPLTGLWKTPEPLLPISRPYGALENTGAVATHITSLRVLPISRP